MRLIEGKKNEALQVKIKEKEKLIGQKIKEYHELADEINQLRRDWKTLVDSERTIHGEKWMLSDQLKYNLIQYEMLPAWLRRKRENDG